MLASTVLASTVLAGTVLADEGVAGQEQRRPEIGQRPGEVPGRARRRERAERAARLDHAEERRDSVGAGIQGNRDALARAKAKGDEAVRDLVGARVQLRVGQPALGRDDRGRVRRRDHPRLELLVQRLIGPGVGRDGIEPGEQFGLLLRRQQAGRADRQVRLGAQPRQQAAEPAGERDRPRRVELAGAERERELPGPLARPAR